MPIRSTYLKNPYKKFEGILPGSPKSLVQNEMEPFME